MDLTRPLALHIDELVLDGFPPLDRGRLAIAVERALARLLAEQGVPAGLAESGTADRLDAGSFEVPAGRDAEAVGAGIARAVYGGLRR
jgi:hypothetical protein